MSDTDWDYEPHPPFHFAWGCLQGARNEPGYVITEGVLPYLDVESAIAAMSFRLPAPHMTWAQVLDAEEVTVMTFIHSETDGMLWRGCKVAFDQLARWWTPEETMWASACAQTHECLQAVLDEEG